MKNTPLLVQHDPERLMRIYRDGLLDDTLPFWITHGVDREQGGFMFCLDRDGAVMDTDKGMWHQGRFTWMLAHLYNTVEPRAEWLELAAHGIDFIRKYGFDDDGRMFFQVTRDGRPVRKRRYIFTETFAAIAFAAYAKASGDARARLIRLGTTILDWMWAWGWDAEYGGMLYYRDVKHWPVQEYWQDMKFWWPHNEAIIATLPAYALTGDDKYAQWHQQVHDWAYAHFPDPEYGEWYGYLHRDGRISVRSKGNFWKGPFHLPRMQLYCWKLLEERRSRSQCA